MRDITRLKLPFPLVFRVVSEKCVRLRARVCVHRVTALPFPHLRAHPSRAPRKPEVSASGKPAASSSAAFEQYAGAFEFSAPEGTAYLPQWMMENTKCVLLT